MVTVVMVETGYVDVVDADGRVWNIAFSCMESPCDVWWQGQWIDRWSHPDGEKAFEAWLDHEHAEREEGRWRELVS